jgi:sugar O-acyltransferase (sialic acid O-acetyltransferase NeuD family)
MENPVMIFGADALGLTALDIFRRNNVVVYGFLDDEKTRHGQEFGDVSVLGDTEDDGFLKLIGQKCEAFVAVSDARVRRKLVKLLNERRKVQPVNAIHDTATVSALANIGHGNLIAAHAIVGPFATVGQHCILQTGSIVDASAQLADYVQLGAGSIINAGAILDEGAFIGAGAVVVSGITVGKNARIGAGSVVIENVAAAATVFGNPAKAV